MHIFNRSNMCHWLPLVATILAIAMANQLAIGGDDAAKPMFEIPNGWKVKKRTEARLVLDAPDLKANESCSIDIMAPVDLQTSFQDWFALALGPDDLVPKSKVIEGKTKRGYPYLKQTRVFQISSEKNLYYHYYGLNLDKGYSLIRCAANSEELFNKGVKEEGQLVESWDASGAFPTAPEP